MKNMTLQILENQKHSVVVSDLYGQGFSAIAQKWDFVTTSGKQAIVIAAAGGPADYFKPNGRYRATPNQILYPINHGTLAACGFNIHEPYMALNVLGANQADRAQILKNLEYRVQNLVNSPQW